MADAAKEKEPTKSVQTYGRKKTATAVAYCKRGKGILNVNGKPLEQVNSAFTGNYLNHGGALAPFFTLGRHLTTSFKVRK